jgi:GNAT superfamily N-acetyltransferase
VLHFDDESTWVDTGRPIGEYNAVVLAQFTSEAVDAQIESVLAHFRRQSRPFTWHVGPTSEPPNLTDRLPAHGLVLDDDEPGMAVELDRVQAPATAPPGLTIETVRDERGLRDWVDVWLFPLPVEVRHELFDPLAARGLGDEFPWRFYVGRLDGRPVAISQLFVGQGVAAVHYVVTIPEARRRGIGAAMTMRVLEEARALGYRVAVLTASPHGIGIYRRLGFNEFCRIRRYVWEPDREMLADENPSK